MMKPALLLRSVFLTAVVGGASLSQAGGVGIRLSDDVVGFTFAGNIASETSAQFEWLHNDDKESDMLAAGLFANGQRGALTGRVGAKAVGLIPDDDKYSGGALAIGGDLALPLNELLRIRGTLFYAPEVLSFSDVEGYRETSLSAEFTLFQNSAIQIGVANLEFEGKGGGEFDFDDGLFFRLQLRL